MPLDVVEETLVNNNKVTDGNVVHSNSFTIKLTICTFVCTYVTSNIS